MAYNDQTGAGYTGTAEAHEPVVPTRRVLSAGTLAGDNVRNRSGEDLGKIEEIMLDLESGRVAYAVLSFGGFLGIGDKLFAVPWSALQVNAAEREFILDVDKQALEHAPGFDKDNWPDMADVAWGKTVHSHYGEQPYWENGSSLRDADFNDTGLAGSVGTRTLTNAAGGATTVESDEPSTTNRRGDY